MLKRYTLLIYIVVAVVVAACDQPVAYSHYESVAEKGWEKNDTVSFGVPPLLSDGNYKEEIGLRIAGDYPFTGLTLIVEQTIVPSFRYRVDTLSCRLIDEEANPLGRGVSHFQYVFHLTTLQLSAGDSLRVDIRHNMKREILPGITDVGVTLTAL